MKGDNLEVIFERKLTSSEVETRIVHLSRDVVKRFPRKPFKISIGGVELIKKIDKYNRISINVKNLAKAGDIIKFYKKSDGSYQVSFESF
jgi:hypothetical protein